MQPLETQNTDLIVQQNIELMQYTKKLKQQLAKSYVAIQRNEQLQKENTELKYENQRLQQENHQLRNYIEKTFETVKHLFSFPIDTFKKLVDSLVKSFEK